MNQQKQNIGKTHIYTGNGKGKTTAAIGLCMRAIGAGKTVLWTQFVKGQEYSEIKLFNQLHPSLIFKNFGRSCFINRTPEQTDIDAAKKD